MPLEDTAMNHSPLSVTAACRGNERCLFKGKDLFLDITVANTGNEEIGFPLAYVSKTGPVIRLVDPHKKADTYLKKNLARLELQEQFTAIPPHKSVTFEWVITSSEIQDFGSHPLDIEAEIIIATRVQNRGKVEDFKGITTIRIREGEGPA
jgi:hypothetical protein